MTLRNMWKNGIRMVFARCQSCAHSADFNVDALRETVEVPKTGQRLRREADRDGTGTAYGPSLRRSRPIGRDDRR